MVTVVKGSIWAANNTLGYISVTDNPYLAVGDGVTDNTAAFNAALAAGKPVFVPTGTFLVGQLVIPSGAVLFGLGADSIVELKNGVDLPLLSLSAVTNITVKHITLNGNKANQTGVGIHAVAVAGGSGHVLESLYIVNSLGDGINVNGGATDIQILTPKITGFVKSGITIENASDIDIISARTYNSDPAAFPGDGITLAPTASTNLVSGVRVIGGYSDSNVGRGFSAVGNGSQNVINCTVSDYYAKSNTSHGIHILTATQIMISNVIAKSNGGDGIRFEGNTTNINATNGIADSNTGYGAREVVSGSTPNYNDFIGCRAVNNVGSNVITKVGANSNILG